MTMGNQRAPYVLLSEKGSYYCQHIDINDEASNNLESALKFDSRDDAKFELSMLLDLYEGDPGVWNVVSFAECGSLARTRVNEDKMKNDEHEIAPADIDDAFNELMDNHVPCPTPRRTYEKKKKPVCRTYADLVKRVTELMLLASHSNDKWAELAQELQVVANYASKRAEAEAALVLAMDDRRTRRSWQR